uniref:Uncharacterized protein n=1 Tax=Astyanax mexicanus TaxID=7994 RepID=A0A3B1K7L5_ASTMX
EAMPTVVPSNDSPLLKKNQGKSTVLLLASFSMRRNPFTPPTVYFIGWALSWRNRGSRSRVLHSRNRLRVSVGFLSTRILSWSLQISSPSRATRTFSVR